LKNVGDRYLIIVVTGCTGFIGTHLVTALVNHGYEVRGTVTEGDATVTQDALLHPVDVCSGNGLLDAFEGAEVVIHLAARNHMLKERSEEPLTEYRKVNVGGTRNVLRAASAVGTKVFFHMSSVKAMGEGSEKVLDEGDDCRPSTPYGISKLESEEAVRAEAVGMGMTVMILRLPMVYGPGNKGNLPRMIHWAENGYPFPVFHPENLRSMIYVGNVVAGILALLKVSPAAGTTYILKDREDYSSTMVYSAICNALGKKPRYLPLPSLAVRMGGSLSEDFRKITGSFRVSSAKFEKDFHFVPPFTLEEGIERTVEWYKRSAR
jgi:nucleoside-diphosphate-sugar epimerase